MREFYAKLTWTASQLEMDRSMTREIIYFVRNMRMLELGPQRSHIFNVLMAANAPGKCISTKSINDDTSELSERKATWIFEPIIIYLLNDLSKITIIKKSWTARHRQWRTGLDSMFAVRNGERKRCNTVEKMSRLRSMPCHNRSAAIIYTLSRVTDKNQCVRAVRVRVHSVDQIVCESTRNGHQAIYLHSEFEAATTW